MAKPLGFVLWRGTGEAQMSTAHPSINVPMNARAVHNFLRWLDKEVTANRVNQFSVTKHFPDVTGSVEEIIYFEKMDIAISFVPKVYKQVKK